MPNEILKDIIDNFSLDKFNIFFREKSTAYKDVNEDLKKYDKDIFESTNRLGYMDFGGRLKDLAVISVQVDKDLTERSSKKAQYEFAKNLLKQEDRYEAGIFIFYDSDGNFRFSLVYPQYHGTKRVWNNFRRFTYFVSKEFTNKTFLQRIGDGDFSTLAKIKEAFSVEKVTKEFYQDIANWYFWAVSHCRFPKDAEAEENGRNIAVIRLITRMIFIWFMRERGLINKDLFEKQQIQDILKNLNNGESSYYTAILQNLFFATLSTKKEKRQFGSEIRGHKGYNPDFGNQYVFRYQEMFKNPGNIKDYFGDIPFLNGGLFECLDDKKNGIIIDGFSRTKKNQPEVPNLLFFGAEKKVDLNKFYGTKNKTHKVRGLLDILSSFNFTIDENSPDDADIALDPELLGRVFENLLASFNPETSTTARKATGSYYTPREIVDYMVAESLKAYFKTHLSDVEKIDEKLEQLFSKESSENPFDEKESKKLVELIESVKIVDPAVGSGAFPMGALNKLVFILNKVDPGNKLWKEAQLKATDVIPDPSARRMAKERIEEFFEGKNADYGRKLYLIQRCIYGVDIQQIAVEIAKLRFFISLLVDEKIDKEKDNWGIEPLPNLDFKIMQGNSLIPEFLGIDFDNGKAEQEQEQAGMLFGQDDDSLIKEFEQKKIDFQNEADKDKKRDLKQEVENLMIRIFETKVKKQKGDYFRQLEEIESKYSALPNQKQREEIIAREKQKLSKKSGFDLENIERQLREFTSKKKTRPFFPWKLYFAEVFEKGGFDVVIGNPPYITYKGKQKVNISKQEINIYLNNFKNSAEYKINSYALFIEKSFFLVNKSGVITYIIPSTILQNEYLGRIRKYILKNHHIEYIVAFGNKVFQAVTDSIIFSCSKGIKESKTKFLRKNDLIFGGNLIFINYDQNEWQKNQEGVINLKTSKTENTVISKIEIKSNPLGKLLNANIGIKRAKSPISQTKKTTDYKKFVVGGNLERFFIKSKGSFILFDKSLFHTGVDENIFLQSEKILVRKTGNILIASYDNSQFYTDQSIYNIYLKEGVKDIDLKYICALLNSKVLNWYFNKKMITNADVFPYIKGIHLKKLPIKKISKNDQQPFITLVDQILAITKYVDYLQNPDKQAKVKEYEKQIDELVYKLYELTDKEIEIVEKNN